MAQYGRVYRDDVEKEMRFKIFSNNFADQTNEEFKAARNGFKVPSDLESTRATPFRYENVTVIPSSMNWRKKGAVTPVKDLGQCGKLFKLLLYSTLPWPQHALSQRRSLPFSKKRLNNENRLFTEYDKTSSWCHQSNQRYRNPQNVAMNHFYESIPRHKTLNRHKMNSDLLVPEKIL
ncbi:putative ananain protein [Helianthus anomalus]